MGALYKQYEVNPVDYIFHSLNMNVGLVEKDTDEWKVLMRYIKQSKADTVHAESIFRIER